MITLSHLMRCARTSLFASQKHGISFMWGVISCCQKEMAAKRQFWTGTSEQRGIFKMSATHRFIKTQSWTSFLMVTFLAYLASLLIFWTWKIYKQWSQKSFCDSICRFGETKPISYPSKIFQVFCKPKSSFDRICKDANGENSFHWRTKPEKQAHYL